MFVVCDNLTRIQYVLHELKIFCVFNFHNLWQLQKFFKNKNFPNYGILILTTRHNQLTNGLIIYLANTVGTKKLFIFVSILWL